MTGWLLDTNVVSEWVKPKPDLRVMEFLRSHPKNSLWISSVTLAELKRGIGSLNQSTRKLALAGWLQNEFLQVFSGQILYLDDSALEAVLELVDIGNKRRFAPRIADTLIAATAIARGLTVVTRNVRDFHQLGVPVLNPFTGESFNLR